jgi:crotonobetainyl-CoA:carnitine CoA-transferase CaiB-like acyl-CoA transferase
MTTQVTEAPLAGIIVLDFSELLPGPFFTQTLAEMGAKVVKIERPPYGDNARRMAPGLFSAINRGKESLLLDLKDPTQRDQVLALVAQADVLVETYRPGVMARLGLDYATLREAYPRLIYVSLSGYGQTGPYAQLPGHDINYLAVAGALAISGPVDGEPALNFGLPVADLCGAMYGLSSTLAALYQRQKTGVGQYLDVAIADCVLHWMNPRLGFYEDAGLITLQQQRNATLVKVAYGAFRCRDGKYLSVAALEDHFWQRLTTVLDMSPFDGEDYRTYGARKDAAQQINDTLARALAALDAEHARELLIKHDVPVASVVEPAHIASLVQFAERGIFDMAARVPLARYPVSLVGMGFGLDPCPDLTQVPIQPIGVSS